MAKTLGPTTSTELDFQRVWQIAEAIGLPLLCRSTSYEKSSMKAGKKFVGWVKLPGVLVTHCTLEFKEVLLHSKPELYFETEHYRGWPAIEMRLSVATDDDIREAIIRAWRSQAPKKILQQHETRKVP